MPKYDYEGPGGKVIELERSIAERDHAPEGYRRILTVAARPRTQVAVRLPGQARDPQCADVAVPRAFREIEQQGVPREKIERDCGFSVGRIKRSWEF